MKIVTILGTRPEIIRLSLIIPKLDDLCDHVLVHTNQNFASSLSEIFFNELKLRKPDYNLGVKGTNFSQQASMILSRTDEVMEAEKPDKLLILGDTNSGLSAIVAKRRGIKVYHMEAGNRCFDDKVPEEVNRKIIDHSSDILMPYTNRSRDNLLKEGFPSHQIYVTGNPILEVIKAYEADITNSNILNKLSIEAGKYFLVTLHRQENVDNLNRLKHFIEAIDQLCLSTEIQVLVSLHPRTQSHLEKANICVSSGVKLMQPFGFFDFIALEKSALCVLSDSGTVQEECCILGIPNITLRDTTERPETIECGSGILTGDNSEMIISCIKTVLYQKADWNPPDEYLKTNVSTGVVKIILGY